MCTGGQRNDVLWSATFCATSFFICCISYVRILLHPNQAIVPFHRIFSLCLRFGHGFIPVDISQPQLDESKLSPNVNNQKQNETFNFRYVFHYGIPVWLNSIKLTATSSVYHAYHVCHLFLLFFQAHCFRTHLIVDKRFREHWTWNYLKWKKSTTNVSVTITSRQFLQEEIVKRQSRFLFSFVGLNKQCNIVLLFVEYRNNTRDLCIVQVRSAMYVLLCIVDNI